MKKHNPPELVMGIAMTTRGIGYVLLQGPETPFDWGLMRRENKDFADASLNRIQKLIQAYHPSVLVMENLIDGRTRHGKVLQRFSRKLLHRAASEQVVVIHFGRRDVRQAFAPVGAVSKSEIAEAIALAIPALAYRLPPVRKLWMSEDARQLIFDATALALTYYVNDREAV